MTVDGKTYVYNPITNEVTDPNGTVISGSVFTATTAEGSTIKIDMADGTYRYIPSTAVAAIGGSERLEMQYKLVDNDGDSKTANSIIDFTSTMTDTVPPFITVDVPSYGTDTTPTITGKTEPNTEVTLVIKDANGDTITLTVTSDGNGDYQIDVTNPLSTGEFTVEATATDAAGNSATSTDTGEIGLFNDQQTVNVYVSEEGLANAIPDSIGIGGDANNSVVASGTLNLAGAVTSLVFDSQNPDFDGMEALTFTGEGTNTLTAKNAAGEDVLTATIDNSGNYEITLLRAVNHANTAGEDRGFITSLQVKATANNGSSDTASIQVSIDDDAPVANVNVSQYVEAAAPTPTSGELLTDGVDVSSAPFGADGGYMESMTVGSYTYTFAGDGSSVEAPSGSGSEVNGSSVTITMEAGNKLTVDMSTGDFDYTAQAGAAPLTIEYTWRCRGQ